MERGYSKGHTRRELGKFMWIKKRFHCKEFAKIGQIVVGRMI